MSRAAQAAMEASYKALKEDFVSNLTGGSIWEINAVTLVAPAAVFLWSTLQSKQSFFKPYTLTALIVDFLLNVSAILLATTLYASRPLLLAGLLVLPGIMINLLPSTSSFSQKKLRLPPSTKTKGAKKDEEPPSLLLKKPFITTYRGAMLVITCLAILAVDFRIFPRRFAKVENWGTSLMDLGVGSFVFSAGLIAARPVLQAQHKGLSPTLSKRLYSSVRHSVPLLILGFVRLWSVKGLDYAEHVTEYGVHWNFFFTLSLLPPFVAVFDTLFTKFVPSYALLALILGGTYQVLLEFTPLKAFILTAPRTSLFSQNREGIFSFFGYLAIFLAGQANGMVSLPRTLGTGTATQQRRRLLLTLLAWSTVWIILFNLSTSYNYGLNLSVSRRLANLPYFLWVAAFNNTQILLFCAIETYFFPSAHHSLPSSLSLAEKKGEEEKRYKEATSRVLDAYNRNGLAVFLVANLGTGAVNMGLRTLDMGDRGAMGVLMGYAVGITAVAVGLDWAGWTVKI